MEFFLLFLYILLIICVLLIIRRFSRISERLNNVEFITGILRAAYNADKAEKNVDSFADDVEKST